MSPFNPVKELVQNQNDQNPRERIALFQTFLNINESRMVGTDFYSILERPALHGQFESWRA